ncbi:hypothetical protein CHARACLAT_021964 [Characodon lateralis]|uniref:Secreted protein n=1 Tax=Characodon lateralis TaxID=208331 RepID=A0ABU7EW08_9TELE|nr:hypothetical protein [Characodon lateralis]
MSPQTNSQSHENNPPPCLSLLLLLHSLACLTMRTSAGHVRAKLNFHDRVREVMLNIIALLKTLHGFWPQVSSNQHPRMTASRIAYMFCTPKSQLLADVCQV